MLSIDRLLVIIFISALCVVYCKDKIESVFRKDLITAAERLWEIFSKHSFKVMRFHWVVSRLGFVWKTTKFCATGLQIADIILRLKKLPYGMMFVCRLSQIWVF